MRHRIFIVASGLSLLLCALLVAACTLTQREFKSAVFRRGPTTYGASSVDGFLSVARWRFDGPPLDPRMIEYANKFVLTPGIGGGGHGDVLSALGFDFFDESIGQTNIFYASGLRSFKVISIRYGTLIFLTALLPAVWAFRARRRQIWRNYWKRSGCCVWCGYELVGNSSGVCPECGRKVGQQQAKASI